MSTASNRIWSIPGLLLLAVLLVAAISISNKLFRGVRLDLTANQLYTMTDGTRNIITSIDEPINLYFYFSDTTSSQLGGLRAYAKRVQEMLEEYELGSDGKIKLHVIDPVPFSEEEDEAAQFGLQAVPVSVSGESVYFGLVGTNALDDQAVIPFFQTDKASFLEYDLSKLVHSLANPKKTVVGIMSALPLNGGFNPATGQPGQEWMIVSQIGQLFETTIVPPTATSIDDEIDVLMIAHPKEFSDDTLFAIEQFMLAGKNALIFVDPHADADQPPTDPNNPASMFQSRASNLAALFDAWGVEFSNSQFVADQKLSLAVVSPDGAGQVRHLGLLGVTSEETNQDDVISADLQSINFGYAGSLSVSDDAAVSMEPILSSSKQSMLMDAQSLMFSQDPNELLDNFVEDDNQYVLAARFSGTVNTAFPELVKMSAEDNREYRSEGTINAIIFADTDVLQDAFWVNVQNFFGRRLANSFANNGDLVFNALDNLTGSSDLISIRGRETFKRPFKVVDDLKRKADEEFRLTEERLQQELTATEQRLNELQTGRTDQGSLMMTPEQQTEVDSFLEQKVRIRKELRDVRRNLDKEIDSLGTRLKAMNIVLVPLVMIVFALFRSTRRRHKVSA